MPNANSGLLVQRVLAEGGTHQELETRLDLRDDLRAMRRAQRGFHACDEEVVADVQDARRRVPKHIVELLGSESSDLRKAGLEGYEAFMRIESAMKRDTLAIIRMENEVARPAKQDAPIYQHNQVNISQRQADCMASNDLAACVP